MTLRSSVPVRKTEATRTSWLEAARAVIATDGYAKSRIVDIAKKAGKSPGLFYLYFEDKYALFCALVNDFSLDLKQRSPGKIEFEEHTAEALEAGIRVFWSAYSKYQVEVAGLLEVSHSDPKMMTVWRGIRQRGLRRFAYRLRKQQELGRCLHVDVDLTASALLGMLEFACFNWHSKKLDFPRTEVDEERAIRTLFIATARVLELDIKSGHG